MNRRQFIKRTAGGVLGLGFVGAAWPPPTAADVLAQPELCTLLGTRRVRELGVCYREAFPEENHVEALRALLSGGTPAGRAPVSTLRKRLAQQIRDDFEAGRTLLLKGWVLSVTEARQCALFTLVHP